MRIKIIFSLVAVLLITGCGSLYEEPETEIQSEVSESTDKSSDEKVPEENENLEDANSQDDTEGTSDQAADESSADKTEESNTEETNTEESNTEETNTETVTDESNNTTESATDLQSTTYLNNQYYGSWHIDITNSNDEYIGVFSDYIIFYNYDLAFGWKFYYEMVEGSESEIILTSLEIEEDREIELDDIYRIKFEKGGEEIAYTIYEDDGVIQSEQFFTGIESIEIDADFLYSIMEFKPIDSFNEEISSFFNTVLIEPFIYDESYDEDLGYTFEGIFINDEFINFIVYNEEGGIMGQYSAEYLLFEKEGQVLFIPYDEFGIVSLYRMEEIDETTLQITWLKSFSDNILYNETTQYKSDLSVTDHLEQLSQVPND